MEVASVLVKGDKGLRTSTSLQKTKQLGSQQKTCDMELVGIKKCVGSRRARSLELERPGLKLQRGQLQLVSLSSPVKWSLPHGYYCSDSMNYILRKGPRFINILLAY